MYRPPELMGKAKRCMYGLVQKRQKKKKELLRKLECWACVDLYTLIGGTFVQTETCKSFFLTALTLALKRFQRHYPLLRSRSSVPHAETVAAAVETVGMHDNGIDFAYN